MINFIVCDSSKDVGSIIKETIERISISNKITSKVTMFEDYDDDFVLKIKEVKKSSIYILDIENTNIGLSIAKMIRKHDRESEIIFLVSNSDNIIDFAYKTVRQGLNILSIIPREGDFISELSESISIAIEYTNKDQYINFIDFKTSYSIDANSILYLTKDDRKTVIVRDDRSYDINLSLTKMEDLLPPCFVKSHRACIVNIKRVERIDYIKKIITFDNGEEIDLVSDKYKRDLVLNRD